MTFTFSFCRSLFTGDLNLPLTADMVNRLQAGSYLSYPTACLRSPLERGGATRRGVDAFSEVPPS
jgi:hypothetical protein